MKEIAFIYTTKAKQNDVSADVAGVPLCRVGDAGETVVAYLGLLWECQIPVQGKEKFKADVKKKVIYLALSDEIESEELPRWLEQQGYKKLSPKDDRVVG